MKEAEQPKRQRWVLHHARPWWAVAPVVASLALAIFGLLMWRENKHLREALAVCEQRHAMVSQPNTQSRQDLQQREQRR